MKMRIGARLGSAIVLCGSLLAAQSAQAVVINPVFAASYTGQNFGIGTIVSLQGNAQAEAAITAATAQISHTIRGNVTANILFYGAHDGAGGFLGASVSGQTVYTYAQYKSALIADSMAHPWNTNLSMAIANLGSGNGAGDPNALVAPTTPDARVLGLNAGVPVPPAFGSGDSTPQFDTTGDFLGGGGSVDAIVFLNLDQPLSYKRPIQPPAAGIKYDARSAMEHEIDEVMGIGGAGSQLNNCNADPSYASDFYGVTGNLYGPLDLYRYAAPGTSSFDCTTPLLTGFNGTSPYFSINGGVTSIDTFNQIFPLIGGDAADWGLLFPQQCPVTGGFGGTGNVQDAFSCSNRDPDVTRSSPEAIAYEAIGYDVPEPATLSLFAMGLMGLSRIRRRHDAKRT